MEIEFGDDVYHRLETDSRFFGGFPYPVVTAYRKRMQQLRSALDERDLFAVKSLRLEKLKGNRSHQHSLRLNSQWRLVIEIHGNGSDKIIIITGIEDYY